MKSKMLSQWWVWSPWAAIIAHKQGSAVLKLRCEIFFTPILETRKRFPLAYTLRDLEPQEMLKIDELNNNFH